MRLFTVGLLSAIALFRSCSSGGTRPIEQSTAERFRDAIGVNVHLQYEDTVYRDEKQVAKALDYLGVNHIRDGAFRRGEGAFDSYVKLAQQGVHFDLFFNSDLVSQISRVYRLEKASPGATELLEGPNEINNEPITFAGRSGVPAGRAYQAKLYAWAKNHREFRSLPVLNYTDWPPSGGRADAVNVHTYARHGVDTRTQIFKDVELAAAALPRGLPRYITETGYPTSPAPLSSPWVAPSDQARLTLISLLESFRLGIRRTYLYELFDESSLANGNPEKNYGLFYQTGTAKPVAQELRAITSQLSSAKRRGLRPCSLSLVIEGAKSLLLTTKTGASMLLIWPLSSASKNVPAFVKIRANSRVIVQELNLLSGELDQPRQSTAWRILLGERAHVYILSST